MTDGEKARLVDFLRQKQCGPCRRADINSEHLGCVEAAELVRLVQRD